MITWQTWRVSWSQWIELFYPGLVFAWDSKSPSLLASESVEKAFQSLAFLPCFPLLGWRRTANELIISQPLPCNSIDYRLEAVSIITTTSIETKCLFVKVSR